MYYDPMISKLVTHGNTRAEALEKMREALDTYVVRGVTHNLGFLKALCDHPRFIDGRITTKFIEEEYPDGFVVRIDTSNDFRKPHKREVDPKKRILFCLRNVVREISNAKNSGFRAHPPSPHTFP